MTNEPIKIDYLVNHPEFIETLAPFIAEHWRPILKHETLESRVAKLRTHLNYNKLPIAWVAYSGSNVFGTASLREHDLDTHQNLTPWLGGLFVLPKFRNRNIGSALCSAVEQHASNTLNIRKLFLFTLDKQNMYKRLGWAFLESCMWCDHSGIIMCKELQGA